jgi:hypothetical protein
MAPETNSELVALYTVRLQAKINGAREIERELTGLCHSLARRNKLSITPIQAAIADGPPEGKSGEG